MIGNTGLSAPTTVSATSLATTGIFKLYGDPSLDSADQAALDITQGAAPTTVNGAWVRLGDALARHWAIWSGIERSRSARREVLTLA